MFDIEPDRLTDTAFALDETYPPPDPFVLQDIVQPGEGTSAPWPLEENETIFVDDLSPAETEGWLADARLGDEHPVSVGEGDVASRGSDAPDAIDGLDWTLLDDERFALSVEERSWEPTFESIDFLPNEASEETADTEVVLWKPWTWNRGRAADEVELSTLAGERLDELLAEGTERWLPDFLPRSIELTLPARSTGEVLGKPSEPQLYAVDGIEVELAPGRGERLTFLPDLPPPPNGRLRSGGTYSYTEGYELFNGEIFNVGSALTASGTEGEVVFREGESPKGDHRAVLFQREDGTIGIGRANGDTLADIQRDFGGGEIDGLTEAQIRAFNPYLPADLHLPESGSPVVEAIGGYALIYEDGKPVVEDLGVGSDAGGQGFTDGIDSAQLGEVTNRVVFAELSSGHVVQIVVPSRIREDGEEIGMSAAQLQGYLGTLEVPVAGRDEPATVVNAATGDAGTPAYAEEFGVPSGQDGVPQDRVLIDGRSRLIDSYSTNTSVLTEVGETRLLPPDDPLPGEGTLDGGREGGLSTPSPDDDVP